MLGRRSDGAAMPSRICKRESARSRPASRSACWAGCVANRGHPLHPSPHSPHLRQRIRRLLAAGLAALVLALGNYLLLTAQTADMLTQPHHGFTPQETPATFHLNYQDVRFPARG